jgi:hypothetical protein
MIHLLSNVLPRLHYRGQRRLWVIGVTGFRKATTKRLVSGCSFSAAECVIAAFRLKPTDSENQSCDFLLNFLRTGAVHAVEPFLQYRGRKGRESFRLPPGRFSDNVALSLKYVFKALSDAFMISLRLQRFKMFPSLKHYMTIPALFGIHGRSFQTVNYPGEGSSKSLVN